MVNIKQTTSLLYNGILAEDINRFYWPNLFIDNLEFSKLQSGLTLEDVRKLLQYNIIDEAGNIQTVDYTNAFNRIDELIPQFSHSLADPYRDLINNGGADLVLYNHIKDFLIKNYMRLYSGINIDESNFSVISDSNTLYLDKTAVENFDVWAKKLNFSKEQLLAENQILSFKDFSKQLESLASEDVNYTAYSDAVTIMQSRLLTKEQAATKTFVPNIFDRVFCFYTHMAELEFDETLLVNANVPEGSFVFQGFSSLAKLSMSEDEVGNKLLNDHY